ncbi:MAG TPA: YciI family protein [Candidatus Limnocylindrales bacterium]|nr:YciI family protein [Candidatus Limnocylindrales bacterium]
MKSRVKKISLVVTLGVAGVLGAQTPVENPLAPYIPKNMKPYYLDLLVKTGKQESAATPAENAERMQKHLAYIRSQVEAGNFVLVGPLTEDNRIRGIAVIRAASLEEAQRIASGDPAVQAGQLSVEVHAILLEDLAGVKFEYPAMK